MVIILIKVIYALIHFIIGVYDFSFYRIPNVLLVALLALYAIYAPFYFGFEVIISSLIVSGIVLAIGFGLYALKYIGGGDAKYLAVASLWMGTQNIIQFILLVVVIGGLLGIIYLLLRDHIVRFSDILWSYIQKAEKRYPFLQHLWVWSASGAERGKRKNISSRMVPYGIAIAAAAILMSPVNLIIH